METTAIDSDFILTTLKSLNQRLRDEFAISQIGLYGSFARNEQTPSSDIDLVFSVADSHFLSISERERLQRILRRRLGRKLDLANEKMMNPFVKYAMQKDVIYVQ
ncbi:nucleotidyltransferase domain-containing protein [Fibrella sp. HMF5335]|uniref:Nucleotidyltransferase domain-containing protein n=1 Tax=Fibrella rubiginis TaxID=2817060 RepID=A0A939GJE7_9BACT|nr:nucleotidyltransferase domain-containing protein [Fibrella rubiginis]MBO0939421.1 nucleotidyltransferase domain-containing protein [Fibrella rubiginis]